MNELVKELVDCGAMVNDADDKASDALYAASLAGHLSTWWNSCWNWEPMLMPRVAGTEMP